MSWVTYGGGEAGKQRARAEEASLNAAQWQRMRTEAIAQLVWRWNDDAPAPDDHTPVTAARD